MTRFLNKFKNNKGTETIEFVILFPLMAFLVFGCMTYMLTIYAKIIVVDAAREGARAEALGTTTAEKKVTEVIKNFGLHEEFIDKVEVTEKDENGTPYIVVQVIYKQPSLFPMLPQLIGSPSWDNYFYLNSVAIFKKERL